MCVLFCCSFIGWNWFYSNVTLQFTRFLCSSPLEVRLLNDLDMRIAIGIFCEAFDNLRLIISSWCILQYQQWDECRLSFIRIPISYRAIPVSYRALCGQWPSQQVIAAILIGRMKSVHFKEPCCISLFPCRSHIGLILCKLPWC